MTEPTAPISVLIVDDHPLVRVGMAKVVNDQPDMRVCGVADSGARALELYRLHLPAVVLMDLRLRGESSVRATGDMCAEFTNCRVLFVSDHDGDEHIHRAMQAGAMGYLFKSVEEDELVDAIREVHAGRRYLPRGVALRLRESRAAAQLTRREQDILGLLGKGLRNRELGRVLGVTEDTVKTHLKSLFRKMGVSDRAEAVHEAFRRGFVAVE